MAWEGKPLVIGGYDSRAVLEYSTVERSWQQLPSVVTARAQCAAVTVNLPQDSGKVQPPVAPLGGDAQHAPQTVQGAAVVIHR